MLENNKNTYRKFAKPHLVVWDIVIGIRVDDVRFSVSFWTVNNLTKNISNKSQSNMGIFSHLISTFESPIQTINLKYAHKYIKSVYSFDIQTVALVTNMYFYF